MNRPILTRRDPGVEKLLVGLPDYATPDRLEPTRRWAVAIMAEASRWQVCELEKRKLLHVVGRSMGPRGKEVTRHSVVKPDGEAA